MRSICFLVFQLGDIHIALCMLRCCKSVSFLTRSWFILKQVNSSPISLIFPIPRTSQVQIRYFNPYYGRQEDLYEELLSKPPLSTSHSHLTRKQKDKNAPQINEIEEVVEEAFEK